MKILIHWLVSAVAILIVAYILPGVHVSGFGVALIVALVLGIINAFLRPLLIIMTLPVTVLSLGLFILVINAALVELTAAIVPSFTVDNFWWALAFAVILAIVGGVLHSFEKNAMSPRTSYN